MARAKSRTAQPRELEQALFGIWSRERRCSMNKERLAAFTDAIVAIAATIMVLELAVPSTSGWQGLMENLPVFLVYIVSFSQIYLVWNNHHDLFEKAEVIEG